MYNNLSDLPMAMHETGKETLYPKDKVIYYLEKSQDRDWYIAHFDQSLSLVDNIKYALQVRSENRIIFNS